MQTMFKAPHDPVPEVEAKLLADFVDVNIERKYFPVSGNMVANLPAQATVFCQYAIALLEGSPLLLEVLLELQARLVLFPNVVWRRSDDETRLAYGDLGEQLQAVAFVKSDDSIGRVAAVDSDARWATAASVHFLDSAINSLQGSVIVPKGQPSVTTKRPCLLQKDNHPRFRLQKTRILA
jgi:hypothetical protein